VAASGCSNFRHLENGRTFFRYGGLYITFSCDPGFRIHGHRTSSCVSGQWARHPPLCVAPGCLSPGKLLHGSTLMSPDGSLVQFTCNTGFRLFGSALLYCKGKSWNGSIPVCKELDIMNLFQHKQTSLSDLVMELNQDMTNLKKHLGAIAITAAKESFLKSSLPGAPQPQPQLTGDLPKDSQKHPNHPNILWHDQITTQASVGTVGPEATITKRNTVGGTTTFEESLIHAPLPVNSPTITTITLLPSSLLSNNMQSTTLVSSTINDQQEQPKGSSRFIDRMSPKGEETRENHLTSTTETRHEVRTPLQVPGVSRGNNLDRILTTADPSAAKTHNSLQDGAPLDEPRVSPEIFRNGDFSRNVSNATATDTDISEFVQVTQEVSTAVSTTSRLDLAGSKNKPLASKPFATSNLANSPPLISSGIHDGQFVLWSTVAVRADEEFVPRTAQTARAPAMDSTPVIPTRYLQPKLLTKGSTMEDKDLLEPHRLSVRQKNGELHGDEIAPPTSSLLISNHDQENATTEQSVVNQTLASTAKHKISVTTSAMSGVPVGHSSKRRPACPYPPLPAHGTFYFHTIPNPAPFQFKHYIQYACYAGYTLANGDVYSYCLEDGRWSGVTPMCIGLTPCSLNNGGCSQVCQVNEHNHAECHCNPGFLLLGDQRTCRDLDECVEGLHECQQFCENTFGSYRCSCSLGFQLSSDSMSCTDVNECMLPAGMARCVFGCVNTTGSFRCVCPAGYSMNITGGHCEDINECMENTGLGPCADACVNTPGSFRCVCSNGYRLAGDGTTCMPECPPGYARKRSDPPGGNSTGPVCVDINECEDTEQTHHHHHQRHKCEWKCVNLPGTHRCICPRGSTRHPNGYQCK
ncbi:fibulin-1-like isoform X2, partial [Clarias magur]